MRFSCRLGIAFISMIGASASAWSKEIVIEPRFSTGLSAYDLDVDNLLSADGDDVLGVDFSDTLVFVGGGLTLNYERFFIDFSGQYSFDGEDDLNAAIVLDDGTSIALDQDVDFDRFESLATAGYRVTNDLAAFIGIRYAEVNFNGSGTLGGVDTDFSTTLTQIGPVLGAGYASPKPLLGGTLVVNTALTYLDGDLNNEVDTNAPFEDSDINVDGTSLGLNGGISWARSIIDDLRLIFGVDFSRYSFDDKDDEADFDEIITRLRTEVRYSF